MILIAHTNVTKQDVIYIQNQSLKKIDINMENPQEKYALDMIQTLLESDAMLPEDERLNPEIMIHLIGHIKSETQETYKEYVNGNRESYKLTEDEFMALYERANYDYLDSVINGLVDKGMVQVGVGEGGDMLYSLTEHGKHYLAKQIDKDFK